MTQTQPPPAPAQGIVVSPTAVAAGVTSTIPLPTTPVGPTPWATPWVVLLNSSPYTLIVASGSTTIQIAAFTSDKVFVFSTGVVLPVTVTPVAGAGVPVAGSDSTVYATWYHDTPPGTYPAALGSGAVSNAVAVATGTVLDAGGLAIPANSSTQIVPLQSTLGFASLSMFIANEVIGSPLVVSVLWTDAAGGDLEERVFVVPPRLIGAPGDLYDGFGFLAVTLPNVGAMFSVTIRNATATAGTADVNIGLTSNAISKFLANDADPTIDPVFPVFMHAAATVNAGAAVPICGSRACYAGPATLAVVSGAAAWIFDLEVMDSLGNWTPNFITVGSTDVPGAAPVRAQLSVILPAAPLRIVATNHDAADHTMTAFLMADDFRVGG